MPNQNEHPGAASRMARPRVTPPAPVVRTAQRQDMAAPRRRTAHHTGGFWGRLSVRLRNFRSGLRRDLERHQPVVLFTLLSVVTLAAYGMWAYGMVDRVSAFIPKLKDQALHAAGMTIETVTIRGREKVSEESILDALDAREGTLLFDFNTVAARTRLEDLSWVKSAKIMRLLPDRIHVELVERQAFAIWQTAGEFLIIDRDGVVTEPVTDGNVERFSHLPHVVGTGANEHAAALLDLLSEAPALKSRLKAASRVGNRRWNLRLDNGIDVRLPDTDVAKAIRDIADLDSNHRLLARSIAVIDLRLPDVLIVRPLQPGQTPDNPDWEGDRRIIVKEREA